MQVSPTFQKFILFHSVFANRKKSKEDFCFCEKSIQHLFVFLFAAAITEAAHTPSSFPGNYTQHLSTELNCVREHLDLFCTLSRFILCTH